MRTILAILLLALLVPVLAQTVDTTPPEVELTGPGKQTTACRGYPLSLMANATDDVGVAYVEWLVNDQVVATDDTPPYFVQWMIPKGRDALWFVKARAYDAAGNVGCSETSWVLVIKCD